MKDIAYNIAIIHAFLGVHNNEILKKIICQVPSFRITSSDDIRFLIKENMDAHTKKSRSEKTLSKADMACIESYLDHHQIKVITYYDPLYPKSLRNIPDPPPVLYLYGQIRETFKIAVVGPRNPSEYAKMMTKRIVKNLSENNITIISGMAMGIDSVAHDVAAKSTAGTMGILGSGIDTAYPATNRWLYEKVKENPGNCLLSEFPIGYPPSKYTFPMRNRLISGLANGVLVSEAGSKSGSLITARHAGEQGKNIYAIPGMINNPLTEGVHRLIRDGAVLITSAADILEDLYPMLKIEADHKKFLNLNDLESSIIGKLEKNPSSLNELLKDTSVDMSEMTRIVSMMEIKGIIKKEKNNKYFVTI